MRKRHYPFDADLRYEYPEIRLQENYGNRQLSWSDSDVKSSACGIQTSIEYHHGLSADHDGPQLQQVC